MRKEQFTPPDMIVSHINGDRVEVNAILMLLVTVVNKKALQMFYEHPMLETTDLTKVKPKLILPTPIETLN